MNNHTGKQPGIERLVRHYKNQFEIEENLNYYTYPDFIRAQRKYVKYSLGSNGIISVSPYTN